MHDVIDLKDVVVDAKMHGGHVEAKFMCDFPNTGHAAGKIDLQTRGEQATVDTLVNLSEFRLKVLKDEGIRPAKMPSISVSLKLKTTGLHLGSWLRSPMAASCSPRVPEKSRTLWRERFRAMCSLNWALH